MYNCRILIQEIQLLRGSFRICSYCTWVSPPGDVYQDQMVGVVAAEHRGHHGWGALAHVQFLSSLWAGVAAASQGRISFKNQT